MLSPRCNPNKRVRPPCGNTGFMLDCSRHTERSGKDHRQFPVPETRIYGPFLGAPRLPLTPPKQAIGCGPRLLLV